MGAAALEQWKTGLPASQQRIHRWNSVSVFSGCGALDLALLHWAKPVLYYEIDPAAKLVLQARMADESLPRGEIIDDAADISAATLQGLREKPNMLTAGFPCQDLSRAGAQKGLQGKRSGLFFEIIRLLVACPYLVVFLENVDGIRSLENVWTVVLDEFLALGFSARWVSLSATVAGCPQCRKRWLFLATRGKSAWVPFADALAPDVPGVSAARPSVSCPAERSGLRFNSGRPDPPRWLAARGDYKLFKDRLRMLGNAVVPQQAYLQRTFCPQNGTGKKEKRNRYKQRTTNKTEFVSTRSRLAQFGSA